jgi:hypothetical protein
LRSGSRNTDRDRHNLVVDLNRRSVHEVLERILAIEARKFLIDEISPAIVVELVAVEGAVVVEIKMLDLPSVRAERRAEVAELGVVFVPNPTVEEHAVMIRVLTDARVATEEIPIVGNEPRASDLVDVVFEGLLYKCMVTWLIQEPRGRESILIARENVDLVAEFDDFTARRRPEHVADGANPALVLIRPSVTGDDAMGNAFALMITNENDMASLALLDGESQELDVLAVELRETSANRANGVEAIVQEAGGIAISATNEENIPVMVELRAGDVLGVITNEFPVLRLVEVDLVANVFALLVFELELGLVLEFGRMFDDPLRRVVLRRREVPGRLEVVLGLFEMRRGLVLGRLEMRRRLVLGRFKVRGRLVLRRLVLGRFVFGWLVLGRFVLRRLVLGRLVLRRLMLGRLVLGRLVLGRLVLGRLVLRRLVLRRLMLRRLMLGRLDMRGRVNRL